MQIYKYTNYTNYTKDIYISFIIIHNVKKTC